MRALQASLSSLREEYLDLQESKSSLSFSTSRTISSQTSESARLRDQVSVLVASFNDAQELVKSRDATIADLRNKLETLRSQERSTENENNGWAVVRDELHRQASYLHELEIANAKLTTEVKAQRDRHAVLEVLREENITLQRKLDVAEELRQRLICAEAELDAARKERDGW